MKPIDRIRAMTVDDPVFMENARKQIELALDESCDPCGHTDHEEMSTRFVGRLSVGLLSRRLEVIK